MVKNTELGFVALAAVSGSAVLGFVPSSLSAAAAAPSSPALRGVSSAQQSAQSRQVGGHPATLATVCGACAVAVAARSSTQKKSRRQAFDLAAQEGVTEPFGLFDPLGLAKGKDAAEFRKLRIAETKHGRVAMMASVGLVLPHFFKVPGFEKVPVGLGAVFTDMGGPGLAALVLGAGLHELVLWKDDESKGPGDFGDPFGFQNSIDVERNYELNNGRMAMFAVLGQIVAELVTGKDAVSQLGL
ncbi:unnamed protein product [Polarella glacialis]|uniref:Uncharacterized protein n=1 Tax=Polarella glacialis TaxID=89957 RepID=A0A813FSW0_POLGL|nr:unnamed protein product [Polarella glacialis]CAE8615386.1 unnamed protein product [Polarella glacialis]